MTQTDEAPKTVQIAEGIDPAKMPGHWLLARMGKRVLRPGGTELTTQMLSELAIGSVDDVVEFAPGMGVTSQLVFADHPQSYVGIERDEQAAAQVRSFLRNDAYRCDVATAQATGLADGVATVAFGEAFLTMQTNENKERMVAEAFRVLKPGGRYGIHEISLLPASISIEKQDEVCGDLARAIRVGARPLTTADWRMLLEGAGFEIRYEKLVPMALLEPRGLVDDEGIRGVMKIMFNIARNRVARSRILNMRKTFQRHSDHLGAISLVAVKPLAKASD